MNLSVASSMSHFLKISIFTIGGWIILNSSGHHPTLASLPGESLHGGARELTPTQKNEEVNLPLPPVEISQESAPPPFLISQATSELRVGVGDRLGIQFLTSPQYNTEAILQPMGSIELIGVGNLFILGMTLEQVEGAIAQVYQSAQLLENPPVRVTLLERPRATVPSLDPLPTLREERLEDPYTLGAGDQISIEIFQVPQYSGQHEILVNGMVNLPQLGSLSLQGMTLEEASQAIANAYENRRILRQPQVTIRLLNTRSVRVSLAGEVNRPGSYTMERQGSLFPTLTQALNTAGGITQLANLSAVEIRRPQRNAPDKIIRANLWDFVQQGNRANDPTLRDGDTIFLPTVTETNLAEMSRIPTISFNANAERPLNIVVIGEVFRPGPYTVTGAARTGAAGLPGGGGMAGVPPTVTRAIQVAGGIKPQADIRRIQIRRRTNLEEERIVEVNLWELLREGDSLQDVVLQEGDTVFVPIAPELNPEEAIQIAEASFSPDTIGVRVVGEIRGNGALRIPPNTPLNQAIVEAGGFNIRAHTRSVELVRLNPNGTVTRRTIEIDFGAPINDDNNPALRNNDVILVRRSTLATVSDTLSEITRPLDQTLGLFLFPLRIFNIFN
ncbi:polysaccharide biosynthesis/export family protein [Spirulina subsalsa FACHB-351]|uniref:Polysaccharide biosynthesis/export family protein n=1 Tax=Spirulina subsalsa FACHB-351 TaxID=234711 RepID=A0ABT3L9W2_9CYAN|nr:polysaccharide biosynthesis/export family protein [Spirulina subsalsa]MCW6038300.1 polysaccharide biosynthesis/export family protein [Spirulina subsalsa FACHB-351]